MAEWGGRRKGSGRPRKEGEKAVPLNASVPESLRKQIREKAAEEEKSVSQVVVEALQKVFKKQ